MFKKLLAVTAFVMVASHWSSAHAQAPPYGACTASIETLLGGGGQAFIVADILEHPNPGFTSFLIAFKAPQLRDVVGHIEVQYFSKSRMRNEAGAIRAHGAWFIVGARHVLPDVMEKKLPEQIVDEDDVSRTTIWFGKILVPEPSGCTDLYTFNGLFDDTDDELPEDVWKIIRPTLHRPS